MAIESFSNQATEDIARGKNSKVARSLLPVALHKKAKKKLFMLHIAKKVSDLRIPSSNRLEKLHGNRKGQYSIRINDQYRICFDWQNESATNVEVVDYH